MPRKTWTCPPRVVLDDLGVTGLEPATAYRGRSKLQVRRVASGVGTLLRLAGRRHEMISRVEIVDRPQQCSRRVAPDPRDAVGRTPGQRRTLEQTDANPSLLLLCRFSFGGRPLPWPAPIGSPACRSSAFWPRTAPTLVCSSPIGRKTTHTLIWRAAEAKRFVTI